MQPLRRWVPAPARARSEATIQAATGPASDRLDTLRSNPLRRDLIAAKDLTFCAEFAVHGGQARSPDGFRGEPELVRMHRAGLLDLERDPTAPYNVVGVSLSAAARGVLAGNEPVAPEHHQKQRETPAPITTDQAHRRNGFEVARAMVGAAVKAEFAAWITQESLGGPGALEQRVMARINELSAPFPT